MNQPKPRCQDDWRPQPGLARRISLRRAVITFTTRLVQITVGQFVAFLLHDWLGE